MAEQVVSKERLDYTVDALISMVVSELAEELKQDEKNILEDFLISKTGKALYDTETKLWCNGPTYIAEIYKKEKGL
ncbi:hypothetical protein SAMN04487831_1054 [Pseudobutyrivibrio sp. UC1225]|uniref:hypothetical protein n=1 Tax=Pseudobutyrivibrio sp. UC1225 TaxID=1798185 RepID=UPI0008EBB4BB|nr:hypothetical protein [Pseudobutyrivibrio sp. UC1225]SFN91628.1 hypothetical protein SAMN04487831_1054 [Pseudobutyrivibrio sp. UC1225]